MARPNEVENERPVSRLAGRGPRTLAIDIGGTGLKLMVLDAAGEPVSERIRVKTPRRAGPDATFAAIRQMLIDVPSFDRVSVGFPGVVNAGVVSAAPNLGTALWCGRDVEAGVSAITGKPTRVLNDADVAGYGAVRRRGVEMVITLGTGMGSSLFVDGKLFPNLELGHHPFRKGCTYEQRVCNAERRRLGKLRWSRRVREVIYQLGPIFNYDVLYVGGGNSRHLEVELPGNVRIVDNRLGLLGGIRLWD